VLRRLPPREVGRIHHEPLVLEGRRAGHVQGGDVGFGDVAHVDDHWGWLGRYAPGEEAVDHPVGAEGAGWWEGEVGCVWAVDEPGEDW